MTSSQSQVQLEMEEIQSFTVVDEAGQDSEVNLDDDYKTIDSVLNDSIQLEHPEPKTEPVDQQNTTPVTSEEILEIEDDDETPLEKTITSKDKHNEETSSETKTEELTQDQEEEETGSHPYLCLIETFEIPKEMLTFTSIGVSKPLETTKFVLVQTRRELEIMLQDLRNAKEVSLDIFWTTRDFKKDIGLLAISTRNTDYLLDVVKLKSQLLLLTEIFLNPRIVKIIFGAKVLSILQTILHVYLVNIFDVEQARKILLEPPKDEFTLVRLVEADYGVSREKINKPDFRLRPLSEKYLNFCRLNAHYLIYMYHDYKNKFILKDFEEYKVFLNSCRDACKVVHKSEESGSLLQYYERELKKVYECQKEVLKKLHDWQFKTAQVHNLRPESILSKGYFMNIVKCLPTDPEEIMQICKSNFVRKDIQEIRIMILETKTSFDLKENSRLHKTYALKRKGANSPPIPLKQKRLGPMSNQKKSRKNQQNKQTVSKNAVIQIPFVNLRNQKTFNQNMPTTTDSLMQNSFGNNSFDATKFGPQSSTPVNSFTFAPPPFQYNSQNNDMNTISTIPSYDTSNLTNLCETTKNLLAGTLNNSNSRAVENETRRYRDFGSSSSQSRELDRFNQRRRSQERQYSQHERRNRNTQDYRHTRRY